jgi:hypothetical protein
MKKKSVALVKQDGRHLDPKSRYVQRLEQEIPRETILALLEPETDPCAKRLFDLMQDPSEQDAPLNGLVYRSQLTYSRLCDILIRNGLVVAAVKTAARMPALVDDIALDAFGRTVVCPKCDGAGHRIVKKAEQRCAACHGAGVLRIIGDKDARANLLESSGMIGKHATGPIVNVNMMQQGIETPESEVARVERALTIEAVTGE